MRRLRPALPLVLALAAACAGGETNAPPSTPDTAGSPVVPGLPTGTLVLATDRGEVRVDVTIAETPEARRRGLMGVRTMPVDAGMVFLEEEPVDGGFWMKDTLIPLSLAVWGEDGRIGAIVDMEPCREAPCPIYDPGVTWIGAVEVNQGFFADRGVSVGDAVRLER